MTCGNPPCDNHTIEYTIHNIYNETRLEDH